MVQTPFQWRYGGHQVFLSGSFDGWSTRTPMNLVVEGSATIFQKIVDLPPGCYQYKFLVDGTWQVDQQQICDPDEYGTLNNIVLVSETGFVLQNVPEASQSSTSGVNNMARPSVATSSRGPFNEPVLQLSDADMDVFRQVLSTHLLTYTTYEMIPDSGKVFALDVEVGVEQAFHVMHEKGLAVVPLWNQHLGQMTGMLTASDFILILLQLQGNPAIFPNEDLSRRTISSWKEWKHQNRRHLTGTSVSLERMPLILADPDDTLADMASRILVNNISAVPIIQSVNGSSPRLLYIVCLSDIIKHLCSHLKKHIGHLPLLQQPVGYLPLGTWTREFRNTIDRQLLTLHPNDSIKSALTLLLEARVSSIPVVDDEGKIVNLFSRSDITSLARDNIYSRIQLNWTTISQVLEVIGETGRDRFQTCTRFDSLYRVMEILSEPDVRRVIVVEASSGSVEGIITLRDVFEFFSR